MNAKRILSIGQCGADHAGISWFLKTHLDDLQVDPASSEAEANAALAKTKYDLILVNRLLDRDWSSGIEIIRRLKDQFADVPMMLVSNLADAQSRAEAAGALPGFGKADMDEAAIARVVGALG